MNVDWAKITDGVVYIHMQPKNPYSKTVRESQNFLLDGVKVGYVDGNPFFKLILESDIDNDNYGFSRESGVIEIILNEKSAHRFFEGLRSAMERRVFDLKRIADDKLKKNLNDNPITFASMVND